MKSESLIGRIRSIWRASVMVASIIWCLVWILVGMLYILIALGGAFVLCPDETILAGVVYVLIGWATIGNPLE